MEGERGETGRQNDATRAQWQIWQEDLRHRAIGLGIAGLYIAGIALSGSSSLFMDSGQHIPLALSAFALAGLILVVRHWRPLWAAWLATIGSLVVVLLVIGWGGLAPVAVLLALPVGFAMLAISFRAGLILAAACTVLVVVGSVLFFQLPLVLCVATLASIWGLCALIWLAMDSLLVMARWAWSNYEEGRRALERSREQQAKLCKTMEDLAEANAQLTRLNHLAQGLRQAAEEERRAKEQFVANVSHELRTPLNMIIGFCEMITDAPETYGSNVPQALLADLEVVLRNSRHLSELIDDVLDLSQIEANRMALTKERVSLAELIHAATVAVRPLIVSKGLSLEIEVSNDLPEVFCDRTRIREVILNLLSNAGRFTERGGVRVRAWQDQGDVVISVADTGPGILTSDLKRIFKPFEQLDGSIRRRYGGTGLGLTISKGFVELHGGKMWVESELGRGSTFYIRLPINPPPPLVSGVTRWFNPHQPYEDLRHPLPTGLPPVRPRLVVLEQGRSLQRLLSRYVDQLEIISATDLDQASRELQRTPAQALLINATTLANALEQVNHLKDLPYDLPILMCAVPEIEQTLGALGASEYLVKPVKREVLLAALDRVVGSNKKVLVVDDEPDALQLFSRMLLEADRGYRVIRAESSRQALQILNHERPDVILLDLVMPEMSGFQLLSAIRSERDLQQIPVILISARDPMGHPVVSAGLAVTYRSGLSVQRLLAAIEALISILGQIPLAADQARPVTVRE
ncbi:MAG: ATP-binding protein [Anaerolineae bacterium]|nr:ATP-binding protein [Anaerolineae bacterium]